MCEILPSMEELLKRAEENGRADAIDEFVNEFATHNEDYDYPCICPGEIEEFAEQIKGADH